MRELYTLETSQLIDLLAKYTSDYTRMMTENNKDREYEKCMLAMKAIQAEIDLRKKETDDSRTNITRRPDFL